MRSVPYPKKWRGKQGMIADISFVSCWGDVFILLLWQCRAPTSMCSWMMPLFQGHFLNCICKDAFAKQSNIHFSVFDKNCSLGDYFFHPDTDLQVCTYCLYQQKNIEKQRHWSLCTQRLMLALHRYLTPTAPIVWVSFLGTQSTVAHGLVRPSWALSTLRPLVLWELPGHSAPCGPWSYETFLGTQHPAAHGLVRISWALGTLPPMVLWDHNTVATSSLSLFNML